MMYFNELNVRAERSELIPTRAHPTDAGLDLRAKQLTILPVGERVLVGTGVQVAIPPGYVGLLVLRSSMSKRHITLINSVGIIDSDYRGELLFALKATDHDEVLQKDERFGQLVIVPVALPEVLPRYIDDETWNDTARSDGGFGSTGT